KRSGRLDFRILAALVVILFLVGVGRRALVRVRSRALVGGSGHRLIVVGQTVLDLGLDLRQVFRLGLQVAGVSPLEFCCQLAAAGPIGRAKLVLAGRVLGL